MNLLKTLSAFLLLTVLPSSAQVLYKIDGNGLKSESYLFGTHHLAPFSVIEQFNAMEPFKKSAQVVGEIDMTQDPVQMAMTLQSHMVAPKDSTLTKVLPASEFNELNESFKKMAPMQGMDLAMLDALKPMGVTTMVTVVLAKEAMPDFDPEKQVDSWFQSEGKTLGKKIVALETAEQQAAVLFDSTPISYQAEALADLLKSPEKALESSKALTKAYMDRDLDAMSRLSLEEEQHPAFMEALLDKRNASWLQQLPAILSQGPSFIAVGALHLAGEKGLVDGLRKLGYTVTPM